MTTADLFAGLILVTHLIIADLSVRFTEAVHLPTAIPFVGLSWLLVGSQPEPLDR